MLGFFPMPSDRRGVTRRDLLKLGGLSLAGLSLPTLLAGEPRQNARPRAKACILVFLEGGPSQVDLWDLKPDAIAEIRGIFRPIATTVPGVQFGEVLPRLAQQMHRLTLIRSVTHRINDHNAGTYYAMTGRDPVESGRLIIADGPGNFPNFGAVLAKLRPSDGALPPFVQLPDTMSNNNVNIAGQSAGFLGGRYDPFVAGDPSLRDYSVPGMQPRDELPAARVHERVHLLQSVDRRFAELRDHRNTQRMDGFYRRAVELVTSPESRRAFDLTQEPIGLRERYGVDLGSDRSLEARQFGGLPHIGQCMLLARRLIEAGVRLVTVTTGRRYCQAWDTHREHFDLLRRSLCPQFDRAFATLLEDLAVRGMLEDTLVVAMGEFGRTPRLGYVTSGAGATANGRDHWPFCYSMLLAGAGLPGGAVYGASDRQGAYPSRDPVTPEDVVATIYHLLGIPLDTEVHDVQNRAHALMLGQPIRALT